MQSVRTAIGKEQSKQNRTTKHTPSVPYISEPATNPDIVIQKKCACGGQCSNCQLENKVQTKLNISSPDDKYEQQADQVAAQVMRMPGPALQRQTEAEDEETVTDDNLIQTKPLLQRTEENTTSDATTDTVDDALSTPGQALDTESRRFFEPRFGQDFSHVRIHTDNKSAQSAKSINAKAYTVKNHIVFSDGNYQPRTSEGKNLLAHELVHTLQQSGRSKHIQRYAACGSQQDCPARDKGESGRAAANPMIVEQVSGASVKGLLIGNFAIGSGSVKSGLAKNALWKTFQGEMAAGSHSDWEIQGYTDCQGSDKVNIALREKRAKSVNSALPATTRSKVRSAKGAPLAECYASNSDEQGRAKNRSALIWVVNIPAPATQPALPVQADVLDHSKCGKVVPGMDQAKAEQVRACIYHSNYVNIMNQSKANIKQVPTPYTAGIAELYDSLLKLVIAGGQNNFPTPTSPKEYPLTSFKLNVSKTTSLNVSSFKLKLEQAGTTGNNGSYLGHTLTLNETSGQAVTKNQKDIERTMYHEAFHFISGEVSQANRSARMSPTPGKQVQQELDYVLVKPYEKQFVDAAQPFWAEAMQKHSTTVSAPDIPHKSKAMAGLQWVKVSNEMLSRIEEAIYLALRDGKGFTSSDLHKLDQGWLSTAGYWPPAIVGITMGSMRVFLRKKQPEIEAKVLPVVWDIQKAYLRARPVS